MAVQEQLVVPLPSAPAPVLGFDVSTRRLAVGHIGPAGVGTAVLSLPQSTREGARLSGAREAIVPWLEALGRGFGVHDLACDLDEDCSCAYSPPPAMAVVEMPFATAHHVRPASYFMVGVVLEALWDVFGLRIEVLTHTPGEWKRAALGAGRGAATKAEVLAWARSVGAIVSCSACGDGLEPTRPVGRGRLDCRNPSAGHDQADALGCAVAGAVRRAVRL